MPQNSHVQNIVAFAFVVIANWILAHLANSWVMPSEVQSAFQTLIGVSVGAWAINHNIKIPNGNGNGNGNGHDPDPAPALVAAPPPAPAPVATTVTAVAAVPPTAPSTVVGAAAPVWPPAS